MAISKTGGISLSEIKAHLKGTDGISSYKGVPYLNSSTNSVSTVEGPSLSFSSFNNLTQLPDNVPTGQTFNLLSSTESPTSIYQNSGDVVMTVDINVTPPESQPVLLYTPVPNKVNPTVNWYETTGGGYTLVSTNSYGHQTSPGWGDAGGTQTSDGRWSYDHYSLGLITGLTLTGLNQIKQEVANDFGKSTSSVLSQAVTFQSTFTTSDDAIGTKTYVAVAIATTSGVGADGEDLGIKQTSQQQVASFKVIVTSAAVAPGVAIAGSVFALPGGGINGSGTIVEYTDGTATSNPQIRTNFSYSASIPMSPGWKVTSPFAYSHVVEKSTDGGSSWTNVTSEFGDSLDGVAHRVQKTYTYSSVGETQYKLTVSASATYTQPDGTTGTAISGSKVIQQSITIDKTVVDNAVPTLVSWTLGETTVTDEYKTITATLNTQHAIGQYVTISDGWYTDYQSPSIWNSDRPITANSMTFTWQTQPSNSSATRTISLTATPVAGTPAWNDATAITKTCTVTNTGEPTIVTSQTGVNVSTLDEGSAFTMTLVGVNFTQNNYTWDTTFPAASVTATSGSFTTSFTAQNVYTGSFTVTSTTRATHYADETGVISVYRDGILYHSSGTLTITNIHAEPVTLPTVTLSSISALASGGHSLESGYNGTVAVSVTLNSDSTFTVGRQGSYIGNNSGALSYASPIPLEGAWIPKITGVGEITSFTSQEDILWQPDIFYDNNVNYSYWGPGQRIAMGDAIASTSFSGSTCTLNVDAENLFSSIHTSSCVFTWQFYNTDSKATITGGTITLTAMATNIPGWIGTTVTTYWWIELGFATHALAMATGLYYEDGTLIPPVFVPVYWWTTAGYDNYVEAIATGLYNYDGSLKTTTVIIDTVTDGWWIAVGYDSYAMAMASGYYYANGTPKSTAVDGGTVIENGITTTVVVITDDTTIDNSQEGGISINTVYSPYGTYVTQHCVGTTLMGTYADGNGGSYNSVIAYNSSTCGYVAPVAIQPTVNAVVEDVDIAAAIAWLEANPINIDDIDFSNIVIDFGGFGI